jgi:methylmalonyl-CoA mutase
MLPIVTKPDLDAPTKAWTEQARAALGADWEHWDASAIPIRPLYTPGAPDAPPPLPRVSTTAGAVELRHEYREPDPERLARALVRDVARELGGAWFQLEPSLRAGADPREHVAGSQEGVMFTDVQAFEAALTPLASSTSIWLDAGAGGLSQVALLAAWARPRRGGIAQVRGGVLCDPLGALAEGGAIACPLESAYQQMARVGAFLWAEGAPVGWIGVDGTLWHEAGASATRELGLMIATALAYLAAMERYGLEPDRVVPGLVFRVALAPRPFEGLAKLRALRALWAGVLAHAGVPATPARIHARVAHSCWAALDPWNNLVRGTLALFPALVERVEGAAVPAFDEGRPDEGDAGRRLAVATHQILREECHLERIADAAAGSWYVEEHAARMARAAWEYAQQIEQRGGMVAALRDGLPQRDVAGDAEARRTALEARRPGIVGVTLHRRAGEPAPTRGSAAEVAAARARAVCRTPPATEVLALALDRAAAARSDDDPAAVGRALVEAAALGAAAGDLANVLTEGGGRIIVAPVRRRRESAAFEGEVLAP